MRRNKQDAKTINNKQQTYESGDVAERGLAAPAFKRPTFRSILPIAVLRIAAACSYFIINQIFKDI